MLLFSAARRFLKNTLKPQSPIHLFLKKYKKLNQASPTVLFWELGGFSAILEKNAMLSLGLNVRGIKTHFIICDGLPQACMQRGREQPELISEWQRRCNACVDSKKHISTEYDLSYSYPSMYSDHKTKKACLLLAETLDIEALLSYQYKSLSVGQLAWSSFNRYMKGHITHASDIQQSEEILLRKYFYAALINVHTAYAVLEKIKPAAVVTSHGVYVDYAPIVMAAYNRKIPAISWASGYADFLHYFTAPKDLYKVNLRGVSEAVWEERRRVPLTVDENKRLDEWFHKRYIKKTARDITIHSSDEELNSLKAWLASQGDKPVVCLFAHISWDACFDMSSMIFESANQWLIASMKEMTKILDVSWIIRVHPGEKSDGSLVTADEVIKKNIPFLPAHIKVLWTDSKINTYDLYQCIDVGITIFGTVGVELTLLGKPVITAGQAHFSYKGFSVDAASQDAYFSLLQNIRSLKLLNKEQVTLARHYAYLYFIQRQVPLNITNKKKGHWGGIDIKRLNELLPGKDPVLDQICDGIIQGKDVVLSSTTLRWQENYERSYDQQRKECRI